MSRPVSELLVLLEKCISVINTATSEQSSQKSIAGTVFLQKQGKSLAEMHVLEVNSQTNALQDITITAKF